VRCSGEGMSNLSHFTADCLNRDSWDFGIAGIFRSERRGRGAHTSDGSPGNWASYGSEVRVPTVSGGG
jgi:hypothetical protein